VRCAMCDVRCATCHVRPCDAARRPRGAYSPRTRWAT
jgi:hypothetical protein